MPTYRYKYPRPAVTVDAVVFTLVEGQLRVLLVKRKNEPFAGMWAIPGGFLEMEEEPDDAARRELEEETGIALRGPLTPLTFYADPDRDPRGRTISLAHVGVIRPPAPEPSGSDDAAEAAWKAIDLSMPLGFDHEAILTDALGWLVFNVAAADLALELLPPKFADDDVRTLFRAVMGDAHEVRSWRARMLREGGITAVPGKAGRYRARTNR